MMKKTQTQDEQALLSEALEILMERMPASKVARLLAYWQGGSGDYLAIRDRLCEGETFDGVRGN